MDQSYDIDVLTGAVTTEPPPLTGLVVSLFERALQRAPIDPDADFFDLGGDSIVAIALMAEIERVAGVQLPPTALFDAPTAALLAQRVTRASVPAHSTVVTLREGAGAPLFIAHGIGGNVLELVPLARRLATSRPVLALQALGVDGRAAPLHRIEDMAAAYLDAIRAVQPHGPYQLAGYSMGGLVALELAHRLRAAGEPVGRLILLDALIHPRHFPAWLRLQVLWRRALRHLRTSRRLPARALPGFAAQCARGLLLSFRRLPADYQLVNESLDHLIPETAKRVIDAGWVAFANYQPRRYDGPAVLIRSSRNDDLASFPCQEPVWRRLIPGLRVEQVPGSHREMVGAHVDAVAEALSHYLDRPGVAHGG